jgi:hypothetical protein
MYRPACRTTQLKEILRDLTNGERFRERRSGTSGRGGSDHVVRLSRALRFARRDPSATATRLNDS